MQSDVKSRNLYAHGTAESATDARSRYLVALAVTEFVAKVPVAASSLEYDTHASSATRSNQSETCQHTQE